MSHETRPAPCFRGFRRTSSAPPPDALARAAAEADRLAGYAEGRVEGLPVRLPALRDKVEALASRIEDAMPTSHDRFAAVQAAVHACCTAAQQAWISGVASTGVASAPSVTASVRVLADALRNLRAVLDEASASVDAR